MSNKIYGIVWVYRDNPGEFDPDNIEVIPGFSSEENAREYCARKQDYEVVPRVVELEVKYLLI